MAPPHPKTQRVMQLSSLPLPLFQNQTCNGTQQLQFQSLNSQRERVDPIQFITKEFAEKVKKYNLTFCRKNLETLLLKLLLLE